jgi:hypothetical protein
MFSRQPVLVAGAVGCMLAVTAGGSLAAAGNDAQESITAVITSHTDVDVGEPGFGAGDYYVETWNLRAAERQVGDGGGSCVFLAVTPDRTTDHCEMDLRLAGGQISAILIDTGGPSGPPGPIVFAVTGGTGEYREARGELVVRTGSTTFQIDLRLR